MLHFLITGLKIRSLSKKRRSRRLSSCVKSGVPADAVKQNVKEFVFQKGNEWRILPIKTIHMLTNDVNDSAGRL